MTKQELQAKYPDFKAIKHDPKPDCKFCKGAGERTLRDGVRKFPCICACVNHELSDFAGETLGEVARKELKRMKNEE